MKKIILSEEQDRLIQNKLNEMLNNNTLQSKEDDVVVSKEIQKPGTSLTQNLTDTANAAKQNGINIKDDDVSLEVSGEVPGIGQSTMKVNPTSNNSSISESILITKKQLNEARLKKLKSDSQVIKVENFLK